jgi:large subunit ribosomal protein L13
MKTYAPKPQDIERRWYVVDAQGAVLGRLATEVASILRGKHKPIYAPHADTGDHVIVINAKDIVLTGGKETKKLAYRHSGYPGGLTATKYGYLLEEKPVFMVEKAIKGMLPHNRLGRSMVKKLSVYEGAEHPHGAQSPQALKLGEIPKWDGLPQAPAPKGEEPAERPASKKPQASKPKARKPATKSADKPAAKKSTAKKSTAKKSTPAKSTAKKSTAKSTERKPRASKEK